MGAGLGPAPAEEAGQLAGLEPEAQELLHQLLLGARPVSVPRREGQPGIAFLEDQDGEHPAENVEGLDAARVRKDEAKGEPGLDGPAFSAEGQ